MNNKSRHVLSAAVVGLGYVGWPLAQALALHIPQVTGFDLDHRKIQQIRLQIQEDKTTNKTHTPRTASITPSDDPACLAGNEAYFVTVPTPIHADNTPDLEPLRCACALVGQAMPRGAVVVFEVTVFPGVTEDVCLPLLAQHSGLDPQHDFAIGYAPERINPGDPQRQLHDIPRIVAARDPQTLDLLQRIYGTIHREVIPAPSIRHAEAAKVVENTQRDVNIAFANEMSTTLHHLGLNASEVFALAQTKWNFLPFRPGLVGGHCISVDPWYLIHAAQSAGVTMPLTLQARVTNEQFSAFLVKIMQSTLQKPSRILVLGLTYKNDVPDVRNSRIFDVIARLTRHKHTIHSLDPLVDSDSIGNPLVRNSLITHLQPPYDGVVLATNHTVMQNIDIPSLLIPKGQVWDIQAQWPQLSKVDELRYWRP